MSTMHVKFPTKKAFKAAVAANPSRIYLDDPSIFTDNSGSLPEVVAKLGTAYVTNHPKRSWFANIRKVGETYKVE